MSAYLLYIAASARKKGKRWALVLLSPDGSAREVAASVAEGSATRLELSAAVEGLRLAPEGARVVIYADNKSLVLAGTERLARWRAQGWKRKRKPLKNVDLLRALADLVDAREVAWVLGSRTHDAGRRARELCRLEAPRLPEPDQVPEPTPPPPPPRARGAPQRIVAYTDGGCRGNPGPGGWGFLLVDTATGAALERAGGEEHTTNNRMEITAAMEALEALRSPPRTVVVRTDSKYLVDLATQWLSGWKRRGWKRAKGEEVANLDLIQRLDALLLQHFVHWEWVKGHAGEPGNEHVDALANRAMDAVEAGEEPGHEARYTESPVSLEE